MHEEDFCCSICLDVFIDPVITTCGHTFCSFCISQHTILHHNCPMCRQKITMTIPNRQMESCTLRWLEDNGRGTTYSAMKTSNRKKRLYMDRAQMVIWTALADMKNFTGSLAEILSKSSVENDLLRKEVERLLWLYKDVGIVDHRNVNGEVRFTLKGAFQ
ncbi:unnamed protein product [Caenorhabditis auriculariae]|uniref:RING-type domain-containing protein n=1 Tax=Caenorhabditis auriculariae TaxID=2777116 RepID=A0A8S1HZU5_9PELO|nr:unnamed protein product [Caenorhabditis auriculariae]